MALMTKKHFDFIVETLAPLKFELSSSDYRAVVTRFSECLLDTNELFDEARFEHECGLNELGEDDPIELT